MPEYIKTPHIAIFCGIMGSGKTKLALDLLDQSYFQHFEYIIVLCPTIRHNRTYLNRPWIKTDPDVWLIEPKDRLNELINALSLLLVDRSTLFILDDVIGDKNLNKRRSSLLELVIACRHRSHSLWFLTQTYTAVPKDLRRLATMVFCWYQKERNDMQKIHEENDVLSDEELCIAKCVLKTSKHACLFLK